MASTFALPERTHAQVNWSSAAALQSNAASDALADRSPALAADGFGNWVAVWHSIDSLGNTIGPDSDILVARSSDGGSTWSPVAALNSNAATDTENDLLPQVSTDGAGVWIAVWESLNTLGNTLGTDSDILFAKSLDNGQTWSFPAPLNSNAATDSGEDNSPQLTTDGAGRWIAVWESNENVGGTIGADRDILLARSTNNGQSWTGPAALNTNAASDSGADWYPELTTDDSGVWIAVWMSADSFGATIGTDMDILYARSTNNGQSWTAPAIVNANAASDADWDSVPQLATDGCGTWIAVWSSIDTLNGSIGSDADILTAVSTNNGQNWTAPRALNSNAASDAGADELPRVTTDRTGTWIAVWESRDTLNGTLDTDYDILYSRSTSNGATWTAPAALNSFATVDGTSESDNDHNAALGTDRNGQWIAVWDSERNVGGTIGTDKDILVATVPITAWVWIEFGYFGVEKGTQSCPYGTVEAADAGMQPGSHVRVHAGTYPENVILDTPATFEAFGGLVTVGFAP